MYAYHVSYKTASPGTTSKATTSGAPNPDVGDAARSATSSRPFPITFRLTAAPSASTRFSHSLGLGASRAGPVVRRGHADETADCSRRSGFGLNINMLPLIA